MVSHGIVEEDLFFDSHDEISSGFDLVSNCEGSPSNVPGNCSSGYEFWIKGPDSVNERRDKFLKWMSLSSDWHENHGHVQDTWPEITNSDIDKLLDDGETVLPSFDCNIQLQLSSSVHSSQTSDATDLQVGDDDKLICRIKNLDNGAEFVVDKQADDAAVARFRELSSDKILSFDEFQKEIGSSGLVQRFLRKDYKNYNMVVTKKKVFSNWRRKFNEMTHLADKVKRAFHMPNYTNSKATSSTQRVHVDVSSKRLKELTSLYTGQEFPAHEGSIRTMKFSPDGLYLASAGEDGIVRVWKVVEDDLIDNLNIRGADPSCLYFSLNHLSKLSPSEVSKEKTIQLKTSKKVSDAACVILPQKVFHLMEKPLHEFQGHKGEVLALSWSGNGHLLSSSVDKTARMWKLGNDNCLGVFSHNDYVTCIEFSPVDDNYFISGSIDGKLRIWDIHGSRVLHWTDIREIITAVCYSPDGKGGVVGSVDGNCRFYDVIDNRLELGAKISLKGKVPGRSVTAFQFCPNDSSKVMVTSANSQIRILSGTNVVDKFKGNRSSLSQAPASFTSDGNYIISSMEDSKVHVWSYKTNDQKSSRRKSRESFLSNNASIAIPWCGLKNKLGAALGIILDSLYKGPSTWPEEKLPLSRLDTVKHSICRSEFKFLKNSWINAINSPNLWGLVIVTAGWDGCIRTFLNYGLPIRF